MRESQGPIEAGGRESGIVVDGTVGCGQSEHDLVGIGSQRGLMKMSHRQVAPDDGVGWGELRGFGELGESAVRLSKMQEEGRMVP